MSSARHRRKTSSRDRSKSLSNNRKTDRDKCEYDSISDGYRLYITEYSSSTSADDLNSLCAKYGKIREKVFISKSKKFAYVVFKYERDALNACKFLDRIKLKGVRLKFSCRQPSTEDDRRPLPEPSRSFRHSFAETRSCYTCGKSGHISKDCPPQRNGRNFFYSSSRSRSRSRRRSRSRDSKYPGRR